MCLGKSGWPALVLSHSFLCLAYPPPLCTGVSLSPPHALRNLMFQELSWAELGARALGAPEEFPVRILPSPSSNSDPPLLFLKPSWQERHRGPQARKEIGWPERRLTVERSGESGVAVTTKGLQRG